jgi:hypothetical protein
MTSFTKDLQQQLRLHASAMDHAQAPKLPGWAKALTKLSTGLDMHAAGEARIEADRRLSPEGKRQAVAKLARDLDVQWLRTLQDDVAKALARIGKLLFSPLPDPKGDVPSLLAFLREQEIRSRYEGAKTTEIDLAYANAVERSDIETQRALLLAPGGSLVTEKVREQLADEHARRTHPEAYAEWQNLQQTQAHVARLEQQLETWATGLGAELPSQAA